MRKNKNMDRAALLIKAAQTPVTQTRTTNGYVSSKELFNRYQQEERDAERERQEAPVRNLINERTKLLRENAANVAAYFSLPIETLLGRSLPDSAVDFGIGDFPEGTAEDTFSEIFAKFAETLEAKEISLNKTGFQRLGRYTRMLIDHRQFELTVTLLEAALVRLAELKCFAADEVSGEILTLRQAQPQAVPELSESQKRQQIEAAIEATPSGTREGQRKCIAVLDSLWGHDVRNMYRQFANFMAETYGVDVMTDTIAREYGSFCDRWNLDPLAAKTLNAWRRELDRRHTFAVSLLTEEEKLAQSIENSDLSSRDVRMNIARRTLDIAAAK
jgi:hypothetical protein